MSEATRNLIAAEILAARTSGLRAIGAVALFMTWLAATYLGPEYEPIGGWTLGLSIAVLGGYSLLTIGALVALFQGASRVLRTGVLRRVVTTHLAPFWVVAAAAVFSGGAVWGAAAAPLVALWLGLGTALAVLSSAYAAARLLEARQLAEDGRTLACAPSEAATGTWKREIAARLEAAS